MKRYRYSEDVRPMAVRLAYPDLEREEGRLGSISCFPGLEMGGIY